jgi:two-component system NtrC family sensor kinase
LRFFHRVTESLTGKLVSVLGLLILVGGGAFWCSSIRTDEKNLMENTIAFVSSFSEVVKRSIRYDMMLFQREHIQRTIESIAASESIKRVRVFDGRGVLFHSTANGDVGRKVDTKASACAGCHKGGGSPRETLADGKQWSIYEDPSGSRVLSFVEPIYNEPECFTASCHAHSPEQKVLGILTTDFSLQEIDMRISKQIIETSIYMLLFLAVSVSLLYLVLWRLVLRPVTTLSKGMKRVSLGDLAQKVAATSEDEIGRLTNDFNAMTAELGTARQRMERWTQSLEEEVERKTREINKTRDKLLRAEKLAALGRLTSEIAHEIRNPLTALGGFGRRLQKFATDEKEKEYADIVVAEVDRLERILRDVLAFSREAKFRLEMMPVTEAVKASLSTFAGVCEEHSIHCKLEFGTDLSVLIDSEQVRQVINNLISNAIDVMPEGGTLTIATTTETLNAITYVVISVSDTGPGIPEDKLHLVFEPFYTTKVAEHGTGLGLSISRKIIEQHGGFVNAENRDGGGLAVSLYFPYQSAEDVGRTPCWEFMNCGRDKNGEVKCPAYPNFGRVCWVVAGTFCEGKVQGTFAQKYKDCRKCEFYRKVQGKEA